MNSYRSTNILWLLNLTAVLALLPACRTTDQEPRADVQRNDDGSAVASYFDRYYEERLKLYPLEATFAGDNRYDDILPNVLTDSVRAELTAFYRRHLEVLSRLDSKKLSEVEQMSCDVLKWECEMNLKQLQFPTHLLPVDQFNSLHLTIGQFAGGTSAQPFKTVRDYENWLKRLDAFTGWCATAVTSMRAGIKQGYVLPKALIRKVTPQMADLAKLPVEDHVFYAPIKLMPAGFSPTDRQRLTEAYADTVKTKISRRSSNMCEPGKS